MKKYRKNKIFYKIIFFITFFVLITPIINAKIKGDNTTKKILGNLSGRNNDFPCYSINVSSSYDYGYNIGRLISSTIKKINLLSHFIRNSNQNEMQDYAQKQIIVLKKYFPDELEELQGLSDYVHIKIKQLLILKKIINSYFSEQCTVTISTGKATKNNQTFLTQNFDSKVTNIHSLFSMFLWRYFSYNLWVVRISTMRYTYAFFGVPIFREMCVINEKGLAFGGNGIQYTSNTSQPIDEGEGLSLVSLRRLTMMTCKNVTEAENLWRNSPRESNRRDGILTALYCDKEGNMVIIESTHSYFVAVYGNSTNMTHSCEDILWHTNHFIWLDPNLTGAIRPEGNPESVIRYQRSKELLEENYGNITLETCKEICRDHQKGYVPNEKDSADICVHPYNNSFKITTFSYIVLPETLTIYYTHRSPCNSRYICRNLTIPLTKDYPLLDYLLW